MVDKELIQILQGARDHILATCPFKKKIAYINITASEREGNKYGITIGLGAGWYVAFQDQAEMDWFERYWERVTQKYSNLVFESLCGYSSAQFESGASMDMLKLSYQMSDPEYIADKGC